MLFCFCLMFQTWFVAAVGQRPPTPPLPPTFPPHLSSPPHTHWFAMVLCCFFCLTLQVSLQNLEKGTAHPPHTAQSKNETTTNVSSLCIALVAVGNRNWFDDKSPDHCTCTSKPSAVLYCAIVYIVDTLRSIGRMVPIDTDVVAISG